MFMRPKTTQPGEAVPDIEKLLKDINQEAPSRILAKYKKALEVSEEMIDANSSANQRIETDA